ncbi:MAG: PAS domain-containing protein, partial [Brevundimonas sp.]|uniref:PAS domain-containing protein n=1 Tax=Brevundimonas sp. TaxID=1871086 RepID=UPI00273702B1
MWFLRHLPQTMLTPLRRSASRFLVISLGAACWARAAQGADEAWVAAAPGGWWGMALAGALAALVSFLVFRVAFLRKTADSAVSATRLQFLFDHAPVAVVVSDMRPHAAWLEGLRADGVKDLAAYLRDRPERLREQFERVGLVALNRAALDLTGLRDIAEARERLPDFGPDFAVAFAAQLEALWAGRRELVHSVGLHRRDGGLVQAIMHWTVPVENGRPDHSRVMSVFTDVTALRQTEERLRQSEDRWQLAVRGINAGIWEVDFASGRFFVSDRSREMLGYARGDLEDSRAAWEALIHPEDRAATTRAMELHLERKTEGYRVDHRLLCKDGRYRWVLARGLAQFDEAG